LLAQRESSRYLLDEGGFRGVESSPRLLAPGRQHPYNGLMGAERHDKKTVDLVRLEIGPVDGGRPQAKQCGPGIRESCGFPSLPDPGIEGPSDARAVFNDESAKPRRILWGWVPNGYTDPSALGEPADRTSALKCISE